jgi:K+-transporting ATPase A subunit
MTGKDYATFRALWTCRHPAVVRHSQNAAVSSLVLPPSPDLALNTAISFSTTSTWQAYPGENTMSYFSQMVGPSAQNFLAGARCEKCRGALEEK